MRGFPILDHSTSSTLASECADSLGAGSRGLVSDAVHALDLLLTKIRRRKRRIARSAEDRE